jgi:steroid 5-alpha reductase family enzyme
MNILEFFLYSILFNLVVFVPAFIYKTDKLTDISYSLTFIFLITLSFVFSEQSAFHLILALMVVLWATRLGAHLLYRVIIKGKDARFDKWRDSFLLFGRFWLLQGLTVPVVLLSSYYAMNAESKGIGLLAILGLVVFVVGLILESVADYQKLKFSINTTNKNKWIDQGVWRLSRHPNYLGEMMVWTGIYIYSIQALSNLDLLFAAISPIYIIMLLMFVSGVPILEKQADDKWGHIKEYRDYKKRVGLLLPRFNK